MDFDTFTQRDISYDIANTDMALLEAVAPSTK